MNTAIMNTVSDKYVTCYLRYGRQFHHVHCSILGEWINEINDKFGFLYYTHFILTHICYTAAVNKQTK